jgi:gas vesicle protein
VSLSSSKNLQDANDEWLDVCESIKTQKERIMGIESAYKVSIRILNWNIQEHTELVTYVENIRNQIKEAVAEIKE